jgi:hypothetical protein
MDELEERIGAISSLMGNWWSSQEIAEELGEPKDRVEAGLERMLDPSSPSVLKIATRY